MDRNAGANPRAFCRASGEALCQSGAVGETVEIVFQTDDIHFAVIVFVEFVASKNRHVFHELTRIKFSPSLRELKAA